jgi:hypothetical protein
MCVFHYHGTEIANDIPSVDWYFLFNAGSMIMENTHAIGTKRVMLITGTLTGPSEEDRGTMRSSVESSSAYCFLRILNMEVGK